MMLSRVQLLMMKGPPPTGSLLKRSLPSAWIAVGEPMNGMSVTAPGNSAFLAFSVNFKVTGSTTSYDPIWPASEDRGDALAGSAMRSQLNFTAAASQLVPSLNFMLGWSLRFHTMASLDVSDSADSGLTTPFSLYISGSKMANAGGASNDPELEITMGSRP